MLGRKNNKDKKGVGKELDLVNMVYRILTRIHIQIQDLHQIQDTINNVEDENRESMEEINKIMVNLLNILRSSPKQKDSWWIINLIKPLTKAINEKSLNNKQKIVDVIVKSFRSEFDFK